MFQQKQKAFTLVELIVVITILAILGTIAFISMQGYSKSSRDSIRIADLSTMKTSLELFHLDAGKYPLPTDGFTITYSGTNVWTQGIFGEITVKNIDRLDEIPRDPLTEKEYTYSLTNTRQEYQLSGLFEGDDLVLNNTLLNQTNAGDITATAIVKGNYNGVLFKTLSGTNCEVLAIPSIISSLLETTTTDLSQIVASGGLVYNGYNNLPADYTTSKYNVTGGFDYNPSSIISYSDTTSCKPLFSSDDDTARKLLIEGLQASYTGTIIANDSNILNIISIDTNDANAVSVLGTAIVNNSLGGSVAVNISSTTSSENRLVYNTVTYTGNGTSQDIVTGIESYDINYDPTRTYSKNSGNNTEYAFDRETFKLYKYINNTPSIGNLGGELITNGTFDTDIIGWNDGGSGLSWSSGNAKYTYSGDLYAYQEIPVNIGKKYIIEFDVNDVSDVTNNLLIFMITDINYDNTQINNVGDNPSYIYTNINYNTTGEGHKIIEFTPTVDNVKIIFGAGGNISGTVLIDNITVKEKFPLTHWEEVTDGSIIPFKSSKIWLKDRTAANKHFIFDTIRGSNEGLSSNDTAIEILQTDKMNSFNINGFTVGANTGGINENTFNYIVWQQAYHKMMITTTNHGKRALVAFDDVSKRSMTLYQGSSSIGHEIPHKLGVNLDFSVVKNLSDAYNWNVKSSTIPDGEMMYLASSVASSVQSINFTNDTNNLILNSTNNALNISTDTYIVYSETSSLNIKVGTYTGDNSVSHDISVGFKPAYVMIKSITNADNWVVYDNKRGDDINGRHTLTIDEAWGEGVADNVLYLRDNSFEVTELTNNRNEAGIEYLYIAYGDSQANGGGSYADIPAGY